MKSIYHLRPSAVDRLFVLEQTGCILCSNVLCEQNSNRGRHKKNEKRTLEYKMASNESIRQQFSYQKINYFNWRMI